MVASFTELWEAHLLRGRLWAEGVPSFVVFPFIIGNDWIAGIAFSGAQVQVPDAFLDEARQALRGIAAGAAHDELEAELGPVRRIRCPHCGAMNYCKIRSIPMSILATCVAAMTWFPVLPRDNPLRCRVCGTRWDSDAA
jgi:DNA-directed RNA polymerase subunit RPC12/RpoP